MTTIALNKLTSAPGNVRRTGAADGIEELAASIAAHGLLQSLVVRKTARGRFAVVAGQRRFLALSALAKRDQVPADLPVECRVLDPSLRNRLLPLQDRRRTRLHAGLGAQTPPRITTLRGGFAAAPDLTAIISHEDFMTTTITTLQRAAWAHNALNCFVRQTRTDNTAHQFGSEDQGDAIADLIADLLHLALLKRLDPDVLFTRAQTHFDAERDEE